MSRFAGDEDEMAQAKARHQANEAKWHREDQQASERMWRDNERRRRAQAADARREGGTIEPAGDWFFHELLNTDGGLIGFRAGYRGELVGMLVLQNGDLVAIAAGDATDASPGGREIMVAFLRLYPRHPKLVAAGQRMLDR